MKSGLNRTPRRPGRAFLIALALAALRLAAPVTPALAGPEAPPEIAPGVLYEKNVDIPTRDGAFLKANVFRPKAEGRYPVLIGLSAYGKDLATKDMHADAWADMTARIPDLLSKSSGKYHIWELLDPELWVPDGYVLVRVDSRGSGKTPGHLYPFGGQEVLDYVDAIEWAGTQPWSNGKVGMSGISYYSIIQWRVAAEQPPHLAAFIPWEGATEFYRDISRHGGILSNVFANLWWNRQILPVQHGNGASPFKDLDDPSMPIGGAEALAPDQLAASRTNLLDVARAHPLDDETYALGEPDFAKITAPFLSAGNWGGLGLHLRGNVEGFVRSASKEKWLELHGSNHYVPFFSAEGQALQKEFFDHYLKGVDNGWNRRPPVMLNIRHADGSYALRTENEWPLARAEYRKLHLDAAATSLGSAAPPEVASVSYAALEQPVVFRTAPFEVETEITGPLMANLWVSSSTSDMDIFATVQLFDPSGKEVTYEGASEPAVPISQGWQRVSQRALDPAMSTPARPYHSHETAQPLQPGVPVEVQLEIWPTCIVVPKGYVLALRLEGKDFSRSPHGKGVMTGSGPFLHMDPADRPADVFGGTNTIHTGGEYSSYLLVPVIPQ